MLYNLQTKRKELLLNGDELRLLQNKKRANKRGGSSFSGVLFQISILSHKEKRGYSFVDIRLK